MEVIRTVWCFIGSPLQPAGVSYIRYRARRHLIVFSWALKNISRTGSWKRKLPIPYGVLVTRSRVYYLCPAEGQHRRLDKGNVVTPPLKTRFSIGCPVQIKKSYFVKCLNSLNKLKTCPLGSVDLIWEWWYRDKESST